MDDVIKQHIITAFREMSRIEAVSQLPDFETFCIAFNRLAARCLSYAEVSEGVGLEELLISRPDIWPCGFPTSKIKLLAENLVGVQLMHSHSLHLLIEEFKKPPKTVPSTVNPEVYSPPKTGIYGNKKPTARRIKPLNGIVRE